MKRIVIVWPGFTGYMGPCFRALAAQCELKLFIEPSKYEQRFDAEAMVGVPFRRVNETHIPEVVAEVQSFEPALTLICGWRTPMARALAKADFPGRKVLAFDMPWEWTLRKLVARLVLWPRLRPFDAAFVPGRRCARYAKWLGFSDPRLVLGSNPSGWERFSAVRGQSARGAEKGFLFAGRFSGEKGIDVLLSAYARYRAETNEPWGLDLVGSGDAVPSALPEGVSRLGFVPPAEMPRVMREHTCLILPSRWEPWGVVAAEAMSAGLLTILSDRCGIVDDVRPTCIVPHDSIAGFADAMKRISAMPEKDRLSEMERTAETAACYSAENWARRVLALSNRPNEDWVIASFWEEHCLECGAPACYGSCPMFERGGHGRCVRVEEKVDKKGEGGERICSPATIRFRRWGKIELMYHGRMMSVCLARICERLNRVLRPFWRILGMKHRAVRWRLLAALGCKGYPNVWRLHLRSERDERLAATIAYEDGREVWRTAVEVKAGVESKFEWKLPRVENGALFRLFPLDGEATGYLHLIENSIVNLNLQPPTSTLTSTSHPSLKCVAWDLDGVVWDGTLSEGDEVKLRPQVMEAVKALDEVGIVSSICSKNDEEVAISKLKELGVEEWFVFPQINWGPKSASLRELAKEMNIGLDAIAFVDDRAENREEVKANCPDIQIFDESPDSLKAILHATVQSSSLGPRRRQMYREEMQRRGAARQFGGDSAAFTEASGLEFELLSVEGDRAERCRELVQRTNQLNLTARRYDESAFASLLAEQECVAVHVWDKYGDYGIVGFLASRGTHIVECCFSCRSAGRGIERKVLAQIANGRKFTADIVETERNAPIRKIIREFL